MPTMSRTTAEHRTPSHERRDLDLHIQIVLVPCKPFDIRGLARMSNASINDDLGPLVTILTVRVHNNLSQLVHVSFCSFNQINLSREVKK